MNTEESISHLAKRGIKADKVGKNQFKVWGHDGEVWTPYRDYRKGSSDGIWTGREVVNLARAYSADSSRNTAIKSNTKHFDKKNRGATRDKIKTEDFDNIPLNGPVKRENRWNWD